MNFTALLDRLDDRINPIVVKELRQAVKSRIVVGILLLFLGLQLFMLGVTLLLRDGGGESITTDWNAGAGVFKSQQVVLLWTIMILVPAYAAIRLAAERADQNVDLMFISTLRPVSSRRMSVEDLPLIGGRDLELFAVLGDGPPREHQPLLLEDADDLGIAERLARVLRLDNLADALLDGDRGDALPV